MSAQLSEWTGRFGRAYTKRNIVDWRTRVPGFCEAAGHLGLTSILEVGCNRGHNLRALQAVYPHATIRGLEPQRYARRLAQADGLNVHDGTIYDIPYDDESHDLVLTCGVLTHVPPDRLDDALSELARVSRLWVLLIEYAGEGEQVTYRGKPDMLWRRNYAIWPTSRSGVLGDEFDRTPYWLLEKP